MTTAMFAVVVAAVAVVVAPWMAITGTRIHAADSAYVQGADAHGLATHSAPPTATTAPAHAHCATAHRAHVVE